MRKQVRQLSVWLACGVWLVSGVWTAAQTPMPAPVNAEPVAEIKPEATNKPEAEKPRQPEKQSADKPNAISETEVLAEINLARRDPQTYRKILEEWKLHYQGKELHRPNRPTILTNEGVAAVDEAIEFLSKQEPLDEVLESKGATAAAKVHALDIEAKDLTGHIGSDGSWPNERLARFGKTKLEMAELIDYGGETAREIVVKIILDDGVASRGHRLHLFNDSFEVVGIALGPSKTWKRVCVVVLAQEFTDTTP